MRIVSNGQIIDDFSICYEFPDYLEGLTADEKYEITSYAIERSSRRDAYTAFIANDSSPETIMIEKILTVFWNARIHCDDFKSTILELFIYIDNIFTDEWIAFLANEMCHDLEIVYRTIFMASEVCRLDQWSVNHAIVPDLPEYMPFESKFSLSRFLEDDETYDLGDMETMSMWITAKKDAALLGMWA
jgi:hypothetical protein